MTSQRPAAHYSSPPLPKLQLLHFGTPERSIKDVLRAYSEIPSPLVVTFGGLAATPRQWHEALNPPLWAEVFKSELDKLYPSCEVNPAVNILRPRKPMPIGSREICSLAFGGSFDGCHEGHLSMLWYCMKILRLNEALNPGSATLYLGITPQRWVERKPHGKFAYSLETRLSILRGCVELLLKSLDFKKSEEGRALHSSPSLYCATWRSSKLPVDTVITVHISELDDAGVGIAGLAPELTHLLVTSDCLKGAEAVNEVRRSKSFHPVTLIQCDLLMSERKSPSCCVTSCETVDEGRGGAGSTKRSSSKIREEVSEKYRIFAGRRNLPYDRLPVHVDILRSIILPSLTDDGESVRDDWLEGSTEESISKIISEYF